MWSLGIRVRLRIRKRRARESRRVVEKRYAENHLTIQLALL